MGKMVISDHLKKGAEKTIKLMQEDNSEEKPIIGEESNFFVSKEKKKGCIGRLTQNNQIYYLHQNF